MSGKRIRHLLCLDWETSGIPKDYQQPFDSGPQGLWIGAAVVETETYSVLKTFDRKVRYEGYHASQEMIAPLFPGLTWSDDAARIHGLTIEGLRAAEPISSVAEDFVWFVREFWGDMEHVTLCGQNPTFDRYFTKQLLYLAKRPFEVMFHHRCVDTFSIGFTLWGLTNSQDLFESVGVERPGTHSALVDALACHKVLLAARDALATP